MKTHTDIALVVNMSGGKDSVRMLGYLCEKYPHVTKYVVMADTGFEHVKPVPAVDWARERTAAYGLEFHVVRNPNKTYLEMVERRRMFPAPKYRQCTSDLKRGPIETWIRRAIASGLIGERIVVNCTGIRSAESAARAKQRPLSRNKRLSTAGRVIWNWMPIFKMSQYDVLKWHSDTGTPLHPVYIWAGGYLRRFSCRLCIFSTDADIHAIYRHDREAFERVSQLEERLGFTMRPEKSLLQIIGQDVPDSRRYGSEEQDQPCI